MAPRFTPGSSAGSQIGSHLGPALIATGAVATAIGGLGVGFRAAGIGYLGQSLLALVLGVIALTVGLRLAARARRTVFESAARRPGSARVSYSTVPYAAPMSTAMAPQVARVRVPAWTPPQLALPPARQR